MKKSHNFIDLTGKSFSLWTVLCRAPDKNRVTRWLCLCACGSRKDVPSSVLLDGRSKSCGCMKGKWIKNSKTIHGKSKSHNSEYEIWKAMKARCSNPNNKRFKRYAGRGISVCDRWNDSFLDFYNDMGPRPEGKSLDRINNDGNYEPSNCRWATNAEQHRNSSSARHITFNGETMILSDWCKRIGVGINTLRVRLENWPIEQALTTPPGCRKSLIASCLILFLTCSSLFSMDALTVVSFSIWGEARSESFLGKHAVASVIFNRAHGRPANFKAVCLKPQAFSCWRKGVFTQPPPDLKKPLDRQAWRDCVALADSMLSGTFTPSVKVKHYAEKKIKNYWTEKMTLVAQIGDHNFFSK